MKENKKRKKKVDEDDQDDEDAEERLTNDEIALMEDTELQLIKMTRDANAEKVKNADSKYCICQRIAKSVRQFSWFG